MGRIGPPQGLVGVDPAATQRSIEDAQQQFTATVTGQYGGTPTGTITFEDGSTELAQVPLSGGVAKYQTSTLAEGKHHIKANYSGDPNYRMSSGLVTQVVQ